MLYFYPRSPCGERRGDGFALVDVLPISIHALLAESDTEVGIPNTNTSKFLSTLSLRRATTPDLTTTGKNNDFYPRSPCGERHFPSTHLVRNAQFLSTLSLRRATQWCFSAYHAGHISIHALLAESDPAPAGQPKPPPYFYPRSPCGERLMWYQCNTVVKEFLSTLSLRRATLFQYQMHTAY